MADTDVADEVAAERVPAPRRARLHGASLRVGPPLVALLGCLWLVLVGLLGPRDVADGARLLWRPLLTVASIMVMTGAAHRLGLLDRLAAGILPRARRSNERLFMLVFVVSAVTSAVLNNDAAVLLLTPVVIVLVRRAYPAQPEALTPFVFAVFMAAGVAPLVVSNPMNMIVAEFAGIGFNTYMAYMLPIAVAGWVLAYVLLKMVFRSRLRDLDLETTEPDASTEFGVEQWQILGLLLSVLVAYPVASLLGGPIWSVALVGALAGLFLATYHRVGFAREMLASDVSWDTLLFLGAVVLLTFGFRNAGFVERLVDLYRDGDVWTIGSVSAVGSALINNHPMGHMNMLAIGTMNSGGETEILAALIGGDLGPRLLPTGSLAGLLWFASLRRFGVHVPLHQFVGIGIVLTVPALALSLLLLSLLA